MDQQTLLAEYQQAFETQRMLVEVRFKLLAFVPTVSGLSIALLRESMEGRLGLSLLGLFATLGIVLYEIRNSQLHDAAVHRLNSARRLMGIPDTTNFTNRPRRFRIFLLFQVWHDRALGIVYGASVGGWVALVVISSSAWASANLWLPLLIAVLAGAAIYEEMIRINTATKRSLIE